MIKSNLILFLLILTFTESFSQILPSYQGIYFKKKIIESNLILHLDASNSSSFDSNDLTVWNDLSSSNNDLNLGYDNYCDKYYNLRFKFNDDISIIKNCQDYINGLYWCFCYYFYGCIDWNWFYPYY